MQCTNSYSGFDAGLLTQNILLSAEALGLGTCPLGGLAGILNSDQGKDIVKQLDLPKNYKVILGISLGYKNESPDAKPRDAAKVKYIN
jgi:nitroreductase